MSNIIGLGIISPLYLSNFSFYVTNLAIRYDLIHLNNVIIGLSLATKMVLLKDSLKLFNNKLHMRKGMLTLCIFWNISQQPIICFFIDLLNVSHLVLPSLLICCLSCTHH